MGSGKNQPPEASYLHHLRRSLGCDEVAAYLLRLYLGAAAAVLSAFTLKLAGAPISARDLVSGLVFLGALTWAEIAHTEENDEWEDNDENERDGDPVE